MPGPVNPYHTLGGLDTIERLVAAFYPRVLTDPDLAPIFPKDSAPGRQRQHRFLTQFLGGPPVYSERYGPPRLRARHRPHAVTSRRRDAWLRCMWSALMDTGLDPEVAETVFARLVPVAEHMVNRTSAPDADVVP